MRANSSFSSLIVVVLALLGGCSPAEPPSDVRVYPEQPAPAPSPAPDADLLRRVEETRASQSQSSFPPPRVRTLIFQCTDEVTFAVRSSGRGLQVYPPRYSNGYVLLAQQPSDAGLYYTTPGAELRMNGDLATLQVGRDRYVDCVSNPAAAAWEDPSRRGTPVR